MFRRSAPVAISLLAIVALQQAGVSALASAPIVTGLTVTSGPTDASTPLVVSGSSLSGASDVLFGTTDIAAANTYPCSTMAGCFHVDSSTQIHVDAPWHVAGTVDVTVKVSGVTSATSSADQYTYVAPTPAEAVLSTNAGPVAGGTAVKLIAATSPGGFYGATSVSFGSVSVSSACPPTAPGAGCFTPSASNPDGEIDAVTPANSASTAAVTVTTAGGTGPCASGSAECQFTWAPTPVVTSVCTGSAPCSTPSGTTNGGTTLTVSGQDFQSSSYTAPTASHPAIGYSVSEVDFVPSAGSTTKVTGACPVPSGTPGVGCFKVTSPTSITVVTPSTPSGSYNLEVVTPGGTSATGNSAYTVTGAAPVVLAVNPGAGPTAGGTSVLISGTGFTGATSITFGSTSVSSALTCPPTIPGTGCFTVQSATVINAVSPSGTASTPQTPVDVRVTTGSGESAAHPPYDSFAYEAAPTVSSVSPATVASDYAAGKQLAVTGTNFEGATNATDAVTDVLLVNGSTSDQLSQCQTSASPGCYIYNSPTSISVNLPAGLDPNTWDIRVVTAGGESAQSTSDQFAVQLPAGEPSISGLSPAAGPAAGGTAVTVSGAGFSGGSWTTTAVHVGSTALSVCPNGTTASCFTVVSPATLTVYVPSGTANTQVDITATVATSDATEAATSATGSSDLYGYAPAPTVTRVAPTSGSSAGGDSVTITGTNFSGPGYAATGVSFGGAAATIDSIPNSTTIVVTTPGHAAGVVDVVVTTPGGPSATSSADHFIYVASQPTMSSISPASGPDGGGTPVTITGSGFLGGVTAIDFGATAVPASNAYPCPTSSSGCFAVTSDTSISAYTPQHADGSVNVTVSTQGGTTAVTANDHFDFLPIPSVKAVSPTNGPLSGGTSVSVTGTGFTAATSVHVGGTSISAACGTSSCFTVNSDTSITLITPPGSAGQDDITVTNGSGTSPATAADLFTYVPVPGVSQLAAITGPAAGGTVVTVTGSNFSGAGYSVTAVQFNGGSPLTPATVTPTSLTVVAPTGTDGEAVDIQVTTAGGTSATSAADRFTYSSHLTRFVSSRQYSLAGNDGSTWQALDDSSFLGGIAPATTSTVLVTANADVWTDTAGYNQDIGICVSGSGVTGTDTGPDGCVVVAWKESGGNAGTFSPNAAAVQAAIPETGGDTYTTRLVWKANRAMPQGAAIHVAAGGAGSGFSPTTMTVTERPSSIGGVTTAAAARQYHLTSSNGSSWTPIDVNHLAVTVTVAASTNLLATANADLWTQAAGDNQDIGIQVTPQGGAPTVIGWKESGGNAGTFSPNAAYVQATAPLPAGTYTIELVWRANHALASGHGIWAAAGSGGTGFSPTTLITQLASATGSVDAPVSTLQYLLTATADDNGTAWRAVDAGRLSLDIPAQSGTCQVVLGGNADLWTAANGINQDLGIEATPQGGSTAVLAWKESGGNAGTFSPNAAYVGTGYTLPADKSLAVELVWRTNAAMSSGRSIAIGAGQGTFSPTSIDAWLDC